MSADKKRRKNDGRGGRARLPSQYDASFRQEIDLALNSDAPSTLGVIVSQATILAACSVLASQPMHRLIRTRLRGLLKSVAPADLVEATMASVDRARSLCYEGENLVYLTIHEAARRLAVPPRTIDRWLDSIDSAEFIPVSEWSETENAPRRISLEVFDRMKRYTIEKRDRPRLIRLLKEDLPHYAQRRQRELTRQLTKRVELTGRDSGLTAGEIVRFASLYEVQLAPASIRNWTRSGQIPSGRGRPSNVYSAEEIASHLARHLAQKRSRQIENLPDEVLRAELRRIRPR